MKTLMKIVGIFFGIIILIVVITILGILITSASSKKLVCTSNEGNITIMYNDSELKGYTAKGLEFDFDEQKNIADDLGIDAYLEQFDSWFQENTSGACEQK